MNRCEFTKSLGFGASVTFKNCLATVNKPGMRNITLLTALVLSFSTIAQAAVELYPLFRDNAVLQRSVPLPVFGTAAEGEEVTVSLDGKTMNTNANDGEWKVHFPPQPAGGRVPNAANLFVQHVQAIDTSDNVSAISAEASAVKSSSDNDDGDVILPAKVATSSRVTAKTNSEDLPEGKIYTYKKENGEAREMEIYFPKGHDVSKKAVPGIIMFHGGGWRKGHRRQFRYLCHYFSTRGIVAATVSYKLATKANASGLAKTESRKRVCITDAKSAIRWYKQHADELGIDPQKIIG